MQDIDKKVLKHIENTAENHSQNQTQGEVLLRV